MKLSQQDQSRFWGCVEKRGPDDCWEWQAYRSPEGYGQTKVEGRHQRAHRVAWTLANGPIPEGLLVCHSCDNPPCCNPKHLFVGTDGDNLVDSFRKGRQPTIVTGKRHGLVKLTEANVRQMRKLYAAGGVTYKQLGRKFGVGYTTAREAVAGKTWKHVK